MVGMPYPNPTDPELRERMRFMDAQQQQQALRPGSAIATKEPGHTSSSYTDSLPQLSVVAHNSTSSSLNNTAGELHCQTQGSGLTAGREYYEDLCMKAVNQCVGRVIRHKGDYAAIVLADARWCIGNAGLAPNVPQVPAGPLRKLPEWIQGSLTVCKSFGDDYGRLHRFHRQMLSSATQEANM